MSPPSIIPLPFTSRKSCTPTLGMPISAPPSWMPSASTSFHTKSPMRPKRGVVSWHGMVAVPALTSQTFRIWLVPGVRFAKLSITTRKVTVNEPPTGSVPSSTPPPSSGNAVPMPSSGMGVVTAAALVKNVLFGT